MRLLLASYLHPSLGSFLGRKVAYVNDAAANYRQAPFAIAEREAIAQACGELTDLSVSTSPLEEVRALLESVDGVYVASGDVFRLVGALRSTGADAVLVAAVKDGLPYAGSSAGAIAAGPSLAPATLMDPDDVPPGFTDFAALNLTPHVVVPHAQGTTGPYTIDTIAQTVRVYGKEWPLVLLRDGQALLVDESGDHLL
nr:Type 1 glutamine amidotransferase-like domain-containing protein [Pseudoclavibacter sp. Marseille-Q3772]